MGLIELKPWTHTDRQTDTLSRHTHRRGDTPKGHVLNSICVQEECSAPRVDFEGQLGTWVPLQGCMPEPWALGWASRGVGEQAVGMGEI